MEWLHLLVRLPATRLRWINSIKWAWHVLFMGRDCAVAVFLVEKSLCMIGCVYRGVVSRLLGRSVRGPVLTVSSTYIINLTTNGIS